MRRRAFTLVEVLVALTVMSIGMVTVFQALRIANDGSARLRDEFAARLVAQQRMASLLARPPGELQPARGVEGKFTWEEQVHRSAVEGLAELNVSVRWASKGRAMQFDLLSMRELEH